MITVRLMFDKVINKEIYGCLVKDQDKYIGFALWAVDSEGFEFSELPGFGTILEIGLIPSYRFGGLGKKLVTYVENNLQKNKIAQCYVSAYGPAICKIRWFYFSWIGKIHAFRYDRCNGGV